MSALPVAVIPARFASTRFPGKPLALLRGKPMVAHVHARCLESGAFSRVLVATEDERIVRAVEGFGGEAVLTSPECASGTDRVAEVARRFPELDAWVNVQGDEPLIAPEALATLTRCFADPGVQMGTLVRPLDPAERETPQVVKVVLAQNDDALYFSRADIPHQRDAGEPPPPRWAHLGLYAYRRATLLRLADLPPTPLEQSEKLEQLRALEHGIRIRCLRTHHRSFGVDTPEDLARAERAAPA